MKIQIPNTIDQIPLEAFQKLQKLENPTEVDTIATLCELNPKLVRAFKARSVDEISQHLNTIFKREFKLVRRFKMDGVEYGFIPNLDDASYGEIDDIREYISDVEQWHLAMGVLFRPVKASLKDKYQIEEYKGKDTYAETMKRMPINVAIGAQVFFWTLITDLLSCIPSAMREEVVTEERTLDFSKNGADTIQSLAYVEMISQELKKSVAGMYMSA